MDPNSLDQKRPVRRMRFQPKAQTRKAPKTDAAKKEENDDTESAKANELLQRFQEGLASGKPKIEKKSEPVRVAFGYGAAIGSSSFNGTGYGYQGKARASTLKDGKEYKEPWNYYSYYPQTLPLRRPYSGDPTLLDEVEFGQETVLDESKINPAMELGMEPSQMEEDSEPRMLFLQLPMTLPAMKRLAGANQAPAGKAGGANPAMKRCGLSNLEQGLMGKVLVYKSGAMKVKLGDTLYNVQPGVDTIFCQDFIKYRVKEKDLCNTGDVLKRAVLTPDVHSILDNLSLA